MTIEHTERTLSYVTKRPSDVYGLKWLPSLEPHISNDHDGPDFVHYNRHFTDLDHEALRHAYGLLDKEPQLIVEIGVDRSEHYTVSSTSTLLKLKPQSCMYVGIDLENKMHLNSLENNIFTIQDNSANHSALYDLMDLHGKTEIDFMFVDGWHSVNQVITEWKYWDRMAPHGVMAFHDSNFHPGPIAVLDAVDRDIFSVEYFGRGVEDWGVAVVKRLKV